LKPTQNNMKKIVVTVLACALSLAAFAQGTVNFINVNSSPALNAPIFLSNGSTRLAGAGFMAELLAGASAGSLSPVASAPFQSGGGAGYFAGGTQIIPGVVGGGTAFIQIRAWSTAAGATYAAAVASGLGDAWGASSVFSVVTGNPSATPPGTPAILVGLQSFNLNPIPEPSTFALAGLGIASLLLFRRRK
jgi:hypothetical protein